MTRGITRGDSAAADRFCAQFGDRIHAYSRKLCRNRGDEAEDLAQEVVMKVLRRIPVLENERSVAAWIVRTATTLAIDRARVELRRRRREQAVAPTEVGESMEPSVEAERTEMIAGLAAAVGELPDSDRRLLLARFDGDRTLAELGREFGMTGAAAHGRIRRGMKRLRSALHRTLGLDPSTGDSR
ncbi:MAG: sigma-70 family RNA polymerase sigma factor [Planctomycetota bacterium]